MRTGSDGKWRRYDATRAGTYAACRRAIRRILPQRGAVVGAASGGLCEELLAESSLRELFVVAAPVTDDAIAKSSTDSIGRSRDALASPKERLAQLADRCQFLDQDQLQTADLPYGLDFSCVNADEIRGRVGSHLSLWASRVRDNGVMLAIAHDGEAMAEVKREADALARRFEWQAHLEDRHLWWWEKSRLGVSFIVPAYNCAHVVGRALDSIVPSNFHAGDELVVVDDASTDQTHATLEQFGRSHPAVQIVSHRVNKGTAAAARNTGIERTSNPLLFCLDADNVLAPGSIGMLAEHLLTSGADAAAFGEIHYFRSSTHRVTHKWIYRQRVSLADALAGVVWPGPSGNYMFTRESWVRAGRYHEPSLENRSLDSWTFGIRQLGTGTTMVCLPDTWYFHQYGHQSHYVQNWRRGNQSLAALIGLIPFLELLEPADVEYIFSQEGRTSWYEALAEHPLKVKGAAPGHDGTIEYLPRYTRAQRGEKLTSVARKVRSRLTR